MGSSATISSIDSSHILSHKSHNTYIVDFKVSVLEREQNYPQNDTKLSTVSNTLLE